jgi:glycosyltransferase involved in cell wall biosynthesis
VEHKFFRPPATDRRNDVPQLIYVGRLVPYKGVVLLLRAAAVAKKSCRFALRIVGGGNQAYRNYCIELASALGLDSEVTFLENQPRASLAELYRSADIFCMPSVETYGLAILEAMSSGCAVLVADLNGPGDIVQPGTGIKVPLVSPDHFIANYAEEI